MIDTFLADAPTLLATLHHALEGETTAEVRRAAHTLKSNGATLGATEFAELCRALEQQAKDGRLDGGSGPRRAHRGGARLARAGARGAAPGGGDASDPVAPGTVLVADDNRMNRLLLGRSLEQQGHTVVFAEHGREALDLLRQRVRRAAARRADARARRVPRPRGVEE